MCVDIILLTTGHHTLTSQCSIDSDTLWRQCEMLSTTCSACSEIMWANWSLTKELLVWIYTMCLRQKCIQAEIKPLTFSIRGVLASWGTTRGIQLLWNYWNHWVVVKPSRERPASWKHVEHFELHTLSSFQGGNVHCTAWTVLQQSLWHAFCKVFPW